MGIYALILFAGLFALTGIIQGIRWVLRARRIEKAMIPFIRTAGAPGFRVYGDDQVLAGRFSEWHVTAQDFRQAQDAMKKLNGRPA